MLDLIIQYGPEIVGALFGLGFLAKFIAARNMAVGMARTIKACTKMDADGERSAKEYEQVGRAVMPLVDEFSARMKGLFANFSK